MQDAPEYPEVFGKLCEQHPQMGGKRDPTTGECPWCMRPSEFVRWFRAEKKEAVSRRQDALAKGEKHYYGKLCVDHASMLGKRYTQSGSCVGCTNQYKSRAEGEKRSRGRKGHYDLTPARYMGKLCDLHPDLKGLRYKSNHACVQCMRESNGASKARQESATNHAEIEAVVSRRWRES